MDNELPTVKENFFYPISPYRGSITNETVIFNAKLQDFAQKVGFIANLYSGGKLASEQVYFEVESLWRELESTKAIIISKCRIKDSQFCREDENPK